MDHKIAALIVAGTDTNWAKQQLRAWGYNAVLIHTVLHGLPGGTEGKVSGDVKEIAHCLEHLICQTYTKAYINGEWENV